MESNQEIRKGNPTKCNELTHKPPITIERQYYENLLPEGSPISIGNPIKATRVKIGIKTGGNAFSYSSHCEVSSVIINQTNFGWPP